MSHLPPFTELPDLGLDVTRPIALLADLHANLEALVAVEEWLDRAGVDQAVVLGDVIGYGASPCEVLARVRERGWPVILGNHEDMLDPVSPGVIRGLARPPARRALEWTTGELDEASIAWLTSRPRIGRVGSEAVAVHGSLADREQCYAYIYDLSIELNLRHLATFGLPEGGFVLHGNTHHARLFHARGGDWRELERIVDRVSLPRAGVYFLNPGSVGYPRDGDTRAAFMVWHPEGREVRGLRLRYDVEAAAQKIDRAGYDPQLAVRLLDAR